MRFPAVPGGTTALRLGLHAQLEMSQWWSPADLATAQAEQLGILVRHAAERSPWWRERIFAHAGSNLEGPWTRERLSQLPTLTREALQDADTALEALPVPPGHGGTRPAHTSGSSGRPVRVLKSEFSLLLWQAVTLRDHLWHRRDVRQTAAVIRFVSDPATAPAPHGKRLPDWGASVASCFESAPTHLLDIRSGPAEQAAFLQQVQPAYLLTYPSALRSLLDHCEAESLRFPSLRQVRTVSEMLRPGQRARCQAVLGVPLVDAYSTQEVGNLALQCPEHAHYHLQSETVLTEVLRDDGTPCEVGEVGRLVVTPLHHFAMPLFRYEVGDLAEVGAPCPCGRGLPVLSRILGRTRDLLHFPDGRQAWPVFADHRFREVAPLRQWRLIQTHLDALTFQVVSERPLTPAEQETLARIVTDRTGFPFTVTFESLDHIPRGPGGKYADFVSRVTP